MIVFELSGEHPELPIEEIKGLYEAYDKEFKELDRENSFLLVENDLDPQILSRLAFTHQFFQVDNVTDIKNLDNVLLLQDLKKAKSFCVRCHGFPSNSAEERRGGEVIWEACKTPVKLDNPAVTLHLIKLDGKVAISLEKFEVDSLKERDPNDRPFFHPLALSPKLARLFLNLARLKKNDKILDPFCGSGSVLIEASFIGLKAIGTDLDRTMIWGCKKNLEHYKLSADVKLGDATDIRIKTDAIVTDPPYARASKMFNKELKELYDKFLKSAFESLRPGGHLVMAIPHEARLGYPSVGFKEVSSHSLYVHKSLTRRIYILRKPNV